MVPTSTKVYLLVVNLDVAWISSTDTGEWSLVVKMYHKFIYFRNYRRRTVAIYHPYGELYVCDRKRKQVGI
jgi:hypothetical protein